MKERLDVLLVKRNLAPSREKAKAMIMAGNVFVDNQREDKAGAAFEDSVAIEVHGNTLKYVSRGGLKLEKAVEQFGLDLSGSSAWISALPPGALPTVCCRMAPRGLCGRCGIWTVCLEAPSG